MVLNKKQKVEVKLHLKDILNECLGRIEMGQIEHNVFEIAEHLNIEIEEEQNG
jgi:hypothetical protein